MQHQDITTTANTIYLPGGYTQTFTYDIQQHMVYRDMVFVLLTVPEGDSYNENVFALNAHGEILWQVQQVETAYPEDCPYVMLTIDKETGDLLLWSWCSWKYWVTPETGKIVRAELTK